MYAQVFVAGTFDRLHKGHEFLLTNAFELGEHVVIGLTSDAYVEKFKTPFEAQGRQNLKFKIQEYKKRKKNLEQWLHERKKRFAVIPIDDPYEPLASDPLVGAATALLVTSDNKKRGDKINAMRKIKGLAPVAIIEVPLVPAEDVKPISSTRIRAREIDRSGRLTLPDNLRPELQKPLGKVMVGKEIEDSLGAKRGSTPIPLIAVGDMSTKTLLDAGLVPFLAIIDGKVGRKPFHEALKSLQLQKVKPFSLKAVKSGPGYISREAIKTISSCLASDTGNQYIKTHQVVLIDGEEDLLVLPAVQYAPLGSVVYYGQPGKGLVEIMVTEETKSAVVALLGKFA